MAQVIKSTPIRLFVAGSSKITDVRVFKAAVRTSGWGERIQHLFVPDIQPFAGAVNRWARQNWIAIDLFKVNMVLGAQGVIAAQSKAASCADHALFILDSNIEVVKEYQLLSRQHKLDYFIYYTVC